MTAVTHRNRHLPYHQKWRQPRELHARTCGAMGVHASAVEKEIGYALLRRQIEAARSAARRGPLATVARISVVVHIVQLKMMRV